MKPTPTQIEILSDAADMLDRLYPGYIDGSGPYNEGIAERDKLIARIRAALSVPAAAVVGEPGSLTYPRELTDDLRDILSRMMWNTGPIAHVLRAGGEPIKSRAEDEQAHVLHWLICLALEHGSEWRAKASERIAEIRSALGGASHE